MAKSWALVRNGAVQNVYKRQDDDPPSVWAPLNAALIVETDGSPQPGDKYDGANFTVAEARAGRAIPAYDFWLRIPRRKRQDIYEYARGAGKFAQSAPDDIAPINEWLEYLRMTDAADLDNTDLRIGLNKLVQAGILTANERRDALA